MIAFVLKMSFCFCLEEEKHFYTKLKDVAIVPKDNTKSNCRSELRHPVDGCAYCGLFGDLNYKREQEFFSLQSLDEHWNNEIPFTER